MLRYLVVMLLASPASAIAADTVCSSDIFMKKVCVADEPSELTGEEVGKLNCLEESKVPAELTAPIRRAFERAPTWLQTQLCNLKGVGVYPTMPGSRTLSWSYYNTVFVGISRQRLQEGYTFAAHQQTMRKQSLNKKKLPEGVTFPDNFGFTSTGDDSGLGVLYLLAHEIGHLIYNGSLPLKVDGLFGKCTDLFGELFCSDFTEKEWGSLSWKTATGTREGINYGVPREENKAIVDYLLPANTSIATVADIDSFFRDQLSSPFATAFAAYSPEEDFCETVAAKVVADNLETWSFRFLDGSTVDMRARLVAPAHPILQKKLDFVTGHFAK